jgi:cytochrome c nitrite reductase small subunit
MNLHSIIPTHRAGIILSVLTGLMLGLGYYTWTYAEGGSYFSNDPRACANCHVMRDYLDSWQKSPHHARATCNDCHTPHDFVPKYFSKGENGLRHSWKFTFQNFVEPLRITQANLDNLQANCVSCHEELTAGIVGRTQHGNSNERTCIHCHAGVGHGARN